MIKVASGTSERRSHINPQTGEFDVPMAGALRHFDTRLSTIACIEDACGDRAVVEVLNGIIMGRRARDQIPLIAAALAASNPDLVAPEAVAAAATVGEAEAFVLALVFALGFTVSAAEQAGGDGARETSPLGRANAGGAGGNSRSAA